MRFFAACALVLGMACPAHAAQRPTLLFSTPLLELSRAAPRHRFPTAARNGFLIAPTPRTAFERSRVVTLAQFFIDDVPVARIGGFEIRFKIILE